MPLSICPMQATRMCIGFPQGTDDWEQAGYPLVVVEPIPVDVD